MTNQEMFDKAVRGLRSQGFTQCTLLNENGMNRCMYADNNGKHCAWGWVDEATWHPDVNKPAVIFSDLRRLGVGLAARLPEAQHSFARDLQSAHDGNNKSHGMEAALRELAVRYHLTFPEN